MQGLLEQFVVSLNFKYSFWSDVWLTMHHNSVWIRNQLDLTFVLILYFSFTSCSMVGQPRTPQWTHYLLTGSDSLPAAMAQYQHEAITLRSRQLLKTGTWLPETC